MNSITRAIGACLVALAFIVPHADAGRVGGPATENVTLAPGQEAAYDVQFDFGPGTKVSVRGDGRANITLMVYDSNGNAFEGVGVLASRAVTLDITRAGYFRIVVRNNSSTLRTNVRVSSN